ncbi:MAG TPA: Qat anti-phage system TatD family nuclease QatD [Sphingomonas sp.]
MIDFHCHLDLYPDPHGLAQTCRDRGLYLLSVTTTPSAWRGTSALAEGAPRIRTALGLHPQIAHERKHELVLFEQLIGETQYVGEIGLDGGSEYKAHWQDQLTVFERALAICRAAGGRVISLHSRRAGTQVLDAIEEHRGAGTPILHWFSGTARELDRAIDLGCWFSVGPAMLRGEKGRLLATRMPRDRILTESDGPFAQFDGRAVWPWEASHATSGLASLWDQDERQVEQQLLANLAQIGGLATARN